MSEARMSTEDGAQASEANRLYWDTDSSVGDIANQLGVSRRALYEAIEPRSAGVPCSECGTETVFANRSALANGSARCPSCEAEIEVPAARMERISEPRVVTAVANGRDRSFAVGVGSAALVGVVVGAIATLMLTHRD
jgi:hypothetical protein